MDVASIPLYRHKIKTPEELRNIIGPMPRDKKVIMCHGVFDIVHPGHVRHMIYAKSKADILVVRSEEHTSELQSLMRISYAVFFLQNKTKKHNIQQDKSQ